jgi:hypothetical protein
MTAKQIK